MESACDGPEMELDGDGRDERDGDDEAKSFMSTMAVSRVTANLGKGSF